MKMFCSGFNWIAGARCLDDFLDTIAVINPLGQSEASGAVQLEAR